MIEKNFKNLDEQIEIFKHKGLIIEDEKYARDVLYRILETRSVKGKKLKKINHLVKKTLQI